MPNECGAGHCETAPTTGNAPHLVLPVQRLTLDAMTAVAGHDVLDSSPRLICSHDVLTDASSEAKLAPPVSPHQRQWSYEPRNSLGILRGLQSQNWTV
jgi:hypothetical protein